MRRVALDAVEDFGQKGGLTQMALGLPNQQRHVTIARQTRQRLIGILDQADRADGRRRQDALTVGLVVERDVARHDRHIKRAAGLTDALDRADKLAHDLGLFRVAEVEVVRRGQRCRARGDQIAVGFGHRLPPAFDRIGLHVARGHVTGKSQRLFRSMHPYNARAKAGDPHGVGHDLAVVLLVNPLAGTVIHRPDQGAQPVHGINGGDVAQWFGG